MRRPIKHSCVQPSNTAPEFRILQPRLNHRVKMVERRAARSLAGWYHNTSGVTSMLEDLKWWPQPQRRSDCRPMLLFKMVHCLLYVNGSNHFQMHQNSVFIQPIIANTQYYKYSYFPHTIKDWNALPRQSLVVDTVESFQSRISQVTHTHTILNPYCIPAFKFPCTNCFLHLIFKLFIIH